MPFYGGNGIFFINIFHIFRKKELSKFSRENFDNSHFMAPLHLF